jgi:hypothetical protein
MIRRGQASQRAPDGMALVHCFHSWSVRCDPAKSPIIYGDLRSNASKWFIVVRGRNPALELFKEVKVGFLTTTEFNSLPWTNGRARWDSDRIGRPGVARGRIRRFPFPSNRVSPIGARIECNKGRYNTLGQRMRCERDLGRCALLSFCDTAEQVNRGLISLEGLRREARQGAAEVGAVERRSLYLRAFVPHFKFHFRVTAGSGGDHGVGYFFEMQFHDRPLRRAEDDKGDAAASQVLLVAHVFIGGDNDIETGRLGSGQKVAVAESIPTAIFGSRDRVTDKRA